MFTEEEKKNRWSLFDLLPISKQIQLHNLIYATAQRMSTANKPIPIPVKKEPELRLVRVK